MSESFSNSKPLLLVDNKERRYRRSRERVLTFPFLCVEKPCLFWGREPRTSRRGRPMPKILFTLALRGSSLGPQNNYVLKLYWKHKIEHSWRYQNWHFTEANTSAVCFQSEVHRPPQDLTLNHLAHNFMYVAFGKRSVVSKFVLFPS